MSSPDDTGQTALNFDQVLNVTRIIIFALIAGLTTFLVFVQFLAPKPANPPPTGPILTYISIGFFVVTGTLSVVLPRIIAAKAVGEIAAQKQAMMAGDRDRASRQAAEAKSDSSGRLLATFQTTTIIAAALREGPGLFGLVAYMIGRSYLALGVGGLAIVALTMLIPTADRLEAWLAEQNEKIDRLAQGDF